VEYYFTVLDEKLIHKIIVLLGTLLCVLKANLHDAS